VADFGLSRVIEKGYYKTNGASIPVRWTPPGINNYSCKMLLTHDMSESIQYGQFTSKSDVWSFGIMLWEMFSRGMTPYFQYSNSEVGSAASFVFTTDVMFKVIEKVVQGYRLDPPENCPSEIAELMKQCWNSHPESRPTFKVEFNRILSQLTQ
jgi:serine/threonine protein kinase